ncbi:translation elongation factor 4, partial [Thermodesulfobacteriota bacterium]
RLLEKTGTVSERELSEQFLDKMDIERERGITIKAQAVKLKYTASDGHEYAINLIDTPGHVDFTYEVSRSLHSCEGAILVVDASQGVEAQTLANVYLALDSDLEILPVLNKIDLPSAEPERIKAEIEDIIGLDTSNAILASAKDGRGTEEILEEIVRSIPPPVGDPNKPLRALIFDSWFDAYKGAIVLIRVFDGAVRKGMKIRLISNDKVFEVLEVGVISPHEVAVKELKAGEVGYLVAGIKDISLTRVGDTIANNETPDIEPFPGFKEATPMVFNGLYPVDSADYENLKEALEKLKLNDASFTYELETSAALGFGFRCGFLGMLHMEIVQERLEREYNLNLISTSPTVAYKVTLINETVLMIDNPANFPETQKIKKIEEPRILATIHTPNDYIGNILKLCEDRRGNQREIQYVTTNRVIITYEIPLNEVVLDFYDKLKSISKGYASLDYEYLDFQESKLEKLDIRINGENVDALSLIVHKSNAYYKGREIASKMKEVIQRQMFEVVIQAVVGNKPIARTSVRALRKNVTAKCYGGDITRKRKLLEKQKAGKKRMKKFGNIELPQEAFLAVLKID